ncbi:plasmid replication initiator protein [Streptomyces cacaoi]
MSSTERDVIRLVHEPGFDRWLDQIKATGGCENPVYLAGYTTVQRAETGEILRHYSTENEPGGRMPVRCRNRRERRCAPCSYLHAGDTYQIVRAGLSGGKGVHDSVQHHPRVLVTLTAPGFGPVHRATDSAEVCRPRRNGGLCPHGLPVGCPHRHPADSSAPGRPLCPACYDYVGHVLWHALAGRLWARFCDGLKRCLASMAGIPRSRLGEQLRLSFAKVAEYQKRGAVHFHAVIRADGPDGPNAAPPPWIDTDFLENAVHSSAATGYVQAPFSSATGERKIVWGEQIDVHPIRGEHFTGEIVTPDAVAAYISKYITKSVSDAGGLDQRVHTYEEIAYAPVNPHIRALMATCWRLGALPEFESLRLRPWAHTLGYRGHALTKSRRYSTTYGELRDVRARYASESIGASDTLTDAAWRYVGSGHTPGEEEIARAVSHELRVARESYRERVTDE